MDQKYVERYRHLHERHWWWRAREAKILALLDDLRPEGGFGPILDVGCGDGLFFDALSSYGEPRGVEVDAGAVRPETLSSGKVHVGPFDRTYEPGTTFGLILMLDVLEHLDADLDALSYAAELLRPGGRMLVTVPAFSWLWTGHDDWNHHRRRYSSRSLREVVDKAGLQVRSCAYYFHWLVPLKLVVRAKEAVLGPSREPAEVPGAFVNSLALWISLAEQRLTKRIGMPFGTSLRAVLSKEG